MKINLIIFFTILFACQGCNDYPTFDPVQFACDNTIIITHPKASKFQDFLDDKVQGGLPGISMLIETPDGIWTGASGMADLQYQTAMESCHVHRIGSTTKTFTATIILQLFQEGLLDLDSRMSDYLPSEIVGEVVNHDQITIRQLLNHTSGLPNILDINYSLNYLNDITRVWTDEEELSMIYHQDAIFNPGEKMDYSNTNYLLLGMIAKQITGQTGIELYQERIFNPLGMNHSFFNDNGQQPDALVRGYFDENGQGNFIDITERSFVAGSMAGGASSNVEDLYHFQKTIWETDLLFDDATKQSIIHISSAPFLHPEKAEYGDENAVNRTDGFGLGWWVDDTDYGKCYWHGGALDGRRCVMRYFPDTQTSIIYMVNGSGHSINELFKKMRRNDVVRLVFE